MGISSSVIRACESIVVTATIANSGAMDGDEVVQVYLAAPAATANFPVPYRQLEAYSRVTVNVSTSVEVEFILDAWSMSVTDNDGERVILPGQYNIWVGGHQPVNLANAALADSTGLWQGSFTVGGSGWTYVSTCANLPRPCYAC